MGGRPWVTEGTSSALGLALVGAALALLAWESLRRRAGQPLPRSVDRVFALLGVLSLAAYVNLGAFRPGAGFVHVWDSFHHYVGAKYFDELGYDGLYDCKVVADAQEPGAAADVAARPLVDLRTNQVISARELVAHPEACLRRFSPARWQDFRADLGVFRGLVQPKAWAALQLDHGFNASPAWMLVASPLTSSRPVTLARLRALGAIDLVLLAAALGAVAWAFGFRVFGIAALVLGAYFPARFVWTGGSLLRWDWLAALLGGLALCRRGRPGWGGALLGYAALSRVFPAFALVGLGLAVVGRFVWRRPPDVGSTRALGGALLAMVLIAPVAEVAHAGPTWSAFAHNLAKHSSVPSGNRMGLPTLLAVDFATPREESRPRWEHDRSTALARRRAAWAVLAAAALVVVALAVRDQPPFAAAALGLLLIPFGASLACYYYAFVAAVALLVARRAQLATIMLALVAASALVARLDRYALDQQYAAQALLAVVGLSFALSLFIGPPPEPAGPAS